MKKVLFFLVSLMLLLVAVSGITLHRAEQKDDPYFKTAEILLETYGFSVDPDSEVLGFEADILEARSSWETYKNSGAEHYNLKGVTFDLSAVFSNDQLIASEYKDSVVRVYYFPLVNSQGVETRVHFLFVDDTLAAAYIVISDPLVASYLNDAGITDPPASFWPLDVSKDVLSEDLDAWAEILRR